MIAERILPIRSYLILVLCLVTFPGSANASGVSKASNSASWLVLYNLDNPESVEWKRWYADMRNIPDTNTLGLTCSNEERIEQTSFVSTIYNPVRQHLLAHSELEQDIVGILVGYGVPGTFRNGTVLPTLSDQRGCGGYSVSNHLQDLSIAFVPHAPPVFADVPQGNPYYLQADHWIEFREYPTALRKGELLPFHYMTARIDAPTLVDAKALTIRAKAIADSTVPIDVGTNAFIYYDYHDDDPPGSAPNNWELLENAVDAEPFNHLSGITFPWREYDHDGDEEPSVDGPAHPDAAFAFNWYKVDGWDNANNWAGDPPGPRILAYSNNSWGAITVRDFFCTYQEVDQYRFVPNALWNGGGYAAAIGATAEPKYGRSPAPGTVLYGLSQGWCLGEAFFRANPCRKWMWELIGDPLLRADPWFKADCNTNGIDDGAEIAAGSAIDADSNSVPDVCDPDMNSNGVIDGLDFAAGKSLDVDSDGVPDEVQRLRVDSRADGDSNSTGLTWADAFATIEHALDAAVEQPWVKEIWIAGGRYVPPVSTGWRPRENLRILGGFAGTESSSDERDWSRYPTTLSADLNGDDTDTNAMAPNAISVFQIYGDYNDGLPSELSGLTIEDASYVAVERLANGNIVQVAPIHDRAPLLVVSNCVFRHNAQRALFALNGRLHLHNTAFTQNPGFLIFQTQETALDIANCTIAGNAGTVSILESALRPIRISMVNTIVYHNENVVSATLLGSFDHLSNLLIEGATEDEDLVITGDDPLFQDALAGNYELTAASPALDAGTSGFWSETDRDLAGRLRILGAAVNFGAFEGRDCNANSIEDVVDIAAATAVDCNTNHLPDACEIAAASGDDCDGDGLPDECEPDCNTNSVPDDCDIAAGTSTDLNTNAVPDKCEDPFVTYVRILRRHGTVGDFYIEAARDWPAATDPRSTNAADPFKIEVGFSRPIDPVVWDDIIEDDELLLLMWDCDALDWIYFPVDQSSEALLDGGGQFAVFNNFRLNGNPAYERPPDDEAYIIFLHPDIADLEGGPLQGVQYALINFYSGDVNGDGTRDDYDRVAICERFCTTGTCNGAGVCDSSGDSITTTQDTAQFDIFLNTIFAIEFGGVISAADVSAVGSGTTTAECY